MPWRVLFRFKQGSRGWTETYYLATSGAAMTKEFMDTLVPYRLGASPPEVTLQSVTQVQEDGSRRSVPYGYNQAGTYSIGAVVNASSQVVSALVSLVSEQGDRRHLWLRGLPDSGLTSLNGDPVPSGTLLGFIDAWILAISDVFAIKRQVPYTEGGEYDWRTVSTLEPSTSPTLSGFTSVIIPGTPFDIGDEIYFRGVDYCLLPGLRGQHRVIGSVTAGNIIQVLWPSGLDPVTVPSPGAARLVEYSYPTINTGTFLRISSHDTGRPTDLPRGRRSATSCRLR